MAIHELKGQIARLPEQPGVYLFYNESGDTLYVGKARVLRDRVRSYLGAVGTSPRIDALLRDAARLETIVTDSVIEALALENHLIKHRNPRFNILLRDDKTYPYLQLTTNEPAPRVLVARRVERDGTVYAGPFMPASLARQTMRLAHRLFGIRSCNEVIDGQRDRPCLEYDIKRCAAPCVASICSLDEYQQSVEQARLLLEGRQAELIEGLRQDMVDAALDERFERAATLRDAIRTLETLRDRQQKMSTPALGDRDVFGVKVGASGAVVQVFQMRRGRVVDRIELKGAGIDLWKTATDRHPSPGEILEAALQQFYAEHEAPPDVHVSDPLPDDAAETLAAWLTDRAGRRVQILVPQRGDKRGLVDLAARNAALAYDVHFGDAAVVAFEALETLRVVLDLPTIPRRIECFDISTLQGTNTVASMVVCVEGRMRKSEYRKFTIRGTAGTSDAAVLSHPDDFASMEEVVRRRYQKLLEQGGPFPDLILIDGGKGQLTAAYAALRAVGLDRLVAVGLAKQEELLFRRDRMDGIALPHDTPALRLVQRIRDEAHRFAITFHRVKRTKAALRSALDSVPGIGPRRRKQLLTTFGSVAGVRRASREELDQAVGAKVAQAVLDHFSGR
ncbi:MAG: excinuclease ABC subunit UvrC [Acidobacteria bacterium]|nr:excinuclease ABC subunit UvrC [Acidobacteriota bacterium]